LLQPSFILNIVVKCGLPLFPAKKEVFAWIKEGKKTIDVRKGPARRGKVAVFQSGPSHLRLQIVKKETGKLTEVIRPDNYQSVIPSAKTFENALSYLRSLYGDEVGLFTAYYVT
jgi:ASC-1-like (ASCH) protein